jgi:hypothetical protein
MTRAGARPFIHPRQSASSADPNSPVSARLKTRKVLIQVKNRFSGTRQSFGLH